MQSNFKALRVFSEEGATFYAKAVLINFRRAQSGRLAGINSMKIHFSMLLYVSQGLRDSLVKTSKGRESPWPDIRHGVCV